jgi:hypothetical protein
MTSRAATGTNAIAFYVNWDPPPEQVTIDVVDYVQLRRRIVNKVWGWIAFPVEDWLYRGEQRVIRTVTADDQDLSMMPKRPGRSEDTA